LKKWPTDSVSNDLLSDNPSLSGLQCTAVEQCRMASPIADIGIVLNPLFAITASASAKSFTCK